jgi:predicted Rdx family selenoprotein
VELIRGGRGDFIVTASGTVIWDKKKMGGVFPDETAMITALRRI